MIEKIGLLTALFMAGLWCGSIRTSVGRTTATDFRWLIAGECGFILVCAALALLFSVSGFTMSLSAAAGYGLVLPLMLLSGFLTGLQFPVAVRLCGGESSRSASFIYAADLGGACLGGLAGGLLLLPVLGFRAAVVLLLLLKTGSLIALLISARGGKMVP
jgi:spermidine synthase